MPRTPDNKNYMGSFICKAFLHSMNDEFCLINPGMIRIDYRKGPLTYDLIFEGNYFYKYILNLAIPFSDIVTST